MSFVSNNFKDPNNLTADNYSGGNKDSYNRKLSSKEETTKEVEKVASKSFQSRQLNAPPPPTPRKKRREVESVASKSFQSRQLNAPPPPTPRKKRRGVDYTNCPFQRVADQVEMRRIRWGNCNLILGDSVGKGDYHQVHQIKEMIGIVPGHIDPTRNYVVKTFHADALARTINNPRARQRQHENGAFQYSQMIEAGIPVIPFMSDPLRDGFTIMPEITPGVAKELIPDKDTPLTEKQRAFFEEIAEYCTIAIKYRIHIDLKGDNLFQQEDGRYAFLDFREEVDPDDIIIDTKKGMCEQLGNGNPEVLDILKNKTSDLVDWKFLENSRP